MFKASNINNTTLSIKNMVLLFLTIVMGFGAVITLGQGISIPSSISNARQTIARVSITATGINTASLIDMSSGGIHIDDSILDEETSFDGRVLGIDDAGDVVYVFSENLVVSGTSAGGGTGYWTGVGSDIYNTNAGNVGIGISNPDYKLHIVNSGSTDIYIEEQLSGNAANINFKNTIRTWALGGDSNPDIFYIGEAGGAMDFAITPAGYVGIGTTTPTVPLQVVGNFIAGGSNNNISGTWLTYSSILGGAGNNILSSHSSIGGGLSNTIGAIKAFIGGGLSNTISASYSFIGGGSGNNITSPSNYSAIVGGDNNTISRQYGFIGGGNDNTINIERSAIVGGDNNTISAIYGFVGGGNTNTIGIGEKSVIVGGYANKIRSESSFIGGGEQNVITGGMTSSAIVGGYDNEIGAEYSFIGGGKGNITLYPYNFIGGGESNDIYAYHGSIGGGKINRIATGAEYSTIAGGYGNNIYDSSSTSFIGGGYDNDVRGSYSIIVGGNINRITYGGYSSIVGGDRNQITGTADYANILGGKDNRIVEDSDYSTIAGGNSNKIYTSSYTNIGGGNNNTITGGANYASIQGGQINTINNGDYSSIAGGLDNNIYTAQKAFIGGGNSNIITGSSNYSTIFGGKSNTITDATYSISAGYRAKNNGYANTFVWNSNTAAEFNAGKANSFLINVPGGVGINTANPEYTLDVNGTGRFTKDLFTEGKIQVNTGIYNVSMGKAELGSVGRYIKNYLGFNTTLSNAEWINKGAGGVNGGSAILGAAGGYMFFATFPTTSSNDQSTPQTDIINNIKMVINKNGNVGIGLTVFDPDYKLEVNGSAKADSIKVWNGSAVTSDITGNPCTEEGTIKYSKYIQGHFYGCKHNGTSLVRAKLD